MSSLYDYISCFVVIVYLTFWKVNHYSKKGRCEESGGDCKSHRHPSRCILVALAINTSCWKNERSNMQQRSYCFDVSWGVKKSFQLKVCLRLFTFLPCFTSFGAQDRAALRKAASTALGSKVGLVKWCDFSVDVTPNGILGALWILWIWNFPEKIQRTRLNSVMGIPGQAGGQ